MFDIKGLIQALFLRSGDREGVYDLRSATQMLQELPESDMLMAQVEIIKALQQLNQDTRINIKDRFKTIPYLDEKARKLQDYLVGVYHGTIIDKGAPLPQVLLTITAFWNEMGNAYQLCLKQAMQSSGQGANRPMANYTLRSMRYYFEHAKWCYLRYMELDSRTWRHINRLYLFAEQQGFADGQIQPYPDSQHTSIRREYIKILMLTLSSPEKMQPGQVEIVADWIDKWGSRIELEEIIRPHRQLFAVNIAGSSPPKRLRRDMVGENWRYWFTDTLVLHIKETLSKMESGTWPAELGLPERSNQPANLELMRNLCNFWSRDIPPPARKHERRSSKKTIRVLRGIDAITNHMAKVTPKQVTSPDGPISQLNPMDIDPARWAVENESTTGFGVQFKSTTDDKLQAGEIVGMLPEDADAPVSIGIVRRLTKRRDGQINAGIETLCANPLVVNITPTNTHKQYRALFSPDNAATNQGRFLFVPQRCYGENKEYTLAAQGKAYRIRIAPAREHAANIVVANFSVLARVNA